MPAYLVRIIDTRDLVGVFVAADLRDLAIIVDECTDPDECEYIRLPTGGLMWAEPAVSIPIQRSSDEVANDADPVPWADATFTEVWWNYVYGFDAKRWRPIFIDKP